MASPAVGLRASLPPPLCLRPTADGLTIVVGLEEHLEEAERAPSEVQKHIANAPALSAFVDKVHVGLGRQTKRLRVVSGLGGCLVHLVTATPNKL